MRNQWKRICALLLAMLMVFTIAPTAFAMDSDEYFGAETEEMQEEEATEEPDEEPEPTEESAEEDSEAPTEEPAEDPEELPVEESSEETSAEEPEQEEEEPETPSEENSAEEPAEEPAAEEPVEEEPEIPEEEPEIPVEESETPAEETNNPDESSEEASIEEPEAAAEAAEEEPEEEPEEEIIEDPAKEFLAKPEGSTYYGKIVVNGDNQPSFTSVSQILYYEFTPPTTGKYKFYSYVDTSEIDPKCEIYDSNWNYITSDDDGGTYYNFAVVAEMTANQVYYLCVSLYSSSNTGKVPIKVIQIKTGWNQIDGNWFYYDSNGNPYTSGVYTINGKKYWFDSVGVMAVNKPMMLSDGKAYRADSSGALTLMSDGWTKIADKYYYVSGGKLASYTIIDINGISYGFDSDYWMYDDEIFFYDGNIYRAKLGGKICKSEWYQDEEGDWYYYDSDGRSITGETTINGNKYYFDSMGRMLRNGAVWEDGLIYIADGKGHLVSFKTGWNQVGDYWYYLSSYDNYYVDEVALISDHYYGFDDQGRMYANTFFTYSSKTYHALSNGVLSTNAWYQDPSGRWYYFGSDAAAVTGLKTINGDQYYLKPYMMKDYLFSYDGQLYYADEKGKVHPATQGWNKIGDRYIYLQGTEIYADKVVKIDGSYYGFDYWGYMYDDQIFELDSYKYYAQAGGQLYTNKWIRNYLECDGAWTYYLVDGKRAESGIYTINGTKYCFGYHGDLCCNMIVEEGGELYIAGKSGALTKPSKEGWILFEGRYYYLKDGAFACGEIREINGKKYGFAYDGHMIDDEMGYVGYSDYCLAKPGGELYTNKWYQDEDGDWYYFTETGASADGLTKIGSKYYFFKYGYLQTNGIQQIDGETWYADESGVATKLSSGWNKIGDYWYYVTTSGTPYKETVQKIGSAYYGFNYYGRMITNTTTLYQGSRYRAGADGKLYTNTWYEDYYSRLYYYGADGKAAVGLTTIGGKKYYFDDYGQMMTGCVVSQDNSAYIADYAGNLTAAKSGWNTIGGRSYYVYKGELLKNTVKRIDGFLYLFGYNGQMLDDDDTNLSGSAYRAKPGGKLYEKEWYKNPLGVWYYYGEEGKALTYKKAVVGNKEYYFDYYGAMVTDSALQFSEGAYFADASGKLTKARQGWNKFNNKWYYVKNDGNFAKEPTPVKGIVYGFDYSDYYMLTDTVSQGMVYNSKGQLVTSGWYKLNGRYVYVDTSEGWLQLAEGLKVINGKTYYFDYTSWTEIPYMYTGEIILANKKYVFGENGAMTSCTTLADGWTLIDGSYYYFKNGKPYTGWVGDYYINEGIMKTDMVVGNYYVGSDGKYVKNQWAGKELTYYAKSDGKLARDEWLKLNGSWYYFSAIHKITGVFVVDGKVYQFDNDGKLTATLSSSVKNGWLKAGSTYAYIKNGQAVRSGRVVDGNNIYYMDEAGLMLKDTVYDGYYYNASGKWEVITGWKKSDGKWYYFDHKGYSKRSFISDGGKTYLLDAYFTNGMATGWVTYYSKLYHFASNGVLDKTITPTESGWIKKDSSWFYYDAKIGYFYGWDEGSELYAIDGKEYGFDRYGRLVKNTVCFAADNRYYFCGSDGSVTRTAGWKTDASGKRWYTDANGRVLEGIQIIDGKTYYFDILFLEYGY